MYKGLLFVFVIALSTNAIADSFRCGSSVVKKGDTLSKLEKKCGQPRSKYYASTDVNRYGNRHSTGVVNWVYDRGRNKDMIVSVRNGEIIKIEPD